MREEETFTWSVGSVEETDLLAAALAPLLAAGDVVVLSGDLGAGKTRFVQGIATALGISEPVTSPTFNILLSYEGQGGAPALCHFDLYRLEDPSELDDIGFDEAIEGDGASFIEWGSRFPDEMPDDRMEIEMSVLGDRARSIEARAIGARSRGLLSRWAAAFTSLEAGDLEDE